MLKSNEEKLTALVEQKYVTDGLAAAMRGESDDEVCNKAANSAGGGVAAWQDSVGQRYKIVGFDIVKSDVRVWADERPNEFKELSEKEGAVVGVADNGDRKGKKYVLRPIAYVAALVQGGDRSSISVTALQSAVRTKFSKEKLDKDLKNKKFLQMSAPTPADFVATYADMLYDKTIELVAFEAKKNRFNGTTNVCAFNIVDEK